MVAAPLVVDTVVAAGIEAALASVLCRRSTDQHRVHSVSAALDEERTQDERQIRECSSAHLS